MKLLIESGIKAGVGLAPILPGLSDRPEQLAEVVKAAREAGATSVWANLLYLRPGTREHFLEALARDWPAEHERYEQLYAGRAYLARQEVEPVRAQVRTLAREHGIGDRRFSPLAPTAARPADALVVIAATRHTIGQRCRTRSPA